MIATSLDGQWVCVRRGLDVQLLERGAGPAVSRLQLESEDADLAFVGPPHALLVVSRAPEAKVTLYQPPYLDATARLDLPGPMQLAGVTGQRIVLLSLDHKRTALVRAAGKGLALQPIDPGSPIDFVVGLDRNQVLFGMLKKLEVWDAVSSRPLLRLGLQLPPPPRHVGPAQGHLWATRPGSDEVFVYRLSDGRPFRHYVGAPIERVIWHAASPVLVLVTPRGLVRLHCFAHSLTLIDAPWGAGMALGQLVAGDDVNLLGIGDSDAEPWRVPLNGAGAPIASAPDDPPPSGPHTITIGGDKLREMRETAAQSGSEFQADAARTAAIAATPNRPPPAATPRGRTWREPLAAFGAELVRGGPDVEVPVVTVDNELGELANRLHLPATAKRALITLYALHLVGEPAISIARLSAVLGEWVEALGQGDLHALAMLRRQGGKVSLRASVTDVLDGAAPRAIRVVGGAPTAPRPGAARLDRDGRTDEAIETDLAGKLGRLAVVHGATALGLLEAHLHGATAVALAAPRSRPQPWPREAGLIVVADAAAPPWVAALPPLT
ncbi:MAG: hypothetical protein JNL83_11555 [Myxococcales bacterium]|nr:hypothetical protein [Myxococcales bacterium]